MSASLVSIDPASPPEWPGILALLTASALPTQGLEDHLATTLVARDGSRVVGSVALELYGRDALLRSLAVVPELRGTGLGRRLAARALVLAREHGAARVYLLTETAAEFFHRMGFRDLKRSDVPDGVRGSVEFAKVCPASAVALVRTVDPDEKR